MASRRRIWFFVRMIVYITVVVVLYMNRGGVPWKHLIRTVRGSARSDSTLTLAGRELAPVLVDRLVAQYQRDYPDLSITVTGGGTNQALEDLLNGRAAAAFLFRSPTSEEKDLFRTLDGDTATIVPVAVGGVMLLAGDAADAGPITLDDVRRLVGGDSGGRCERFYVPDPNEGLWDAVRTELGVNNSPAPRLIVYLEDSRAVLQAVRRDSLAWGMVSSLNTPVDPEAGLPAGVRFVSLETESGNGPAFPTYENVATGAYPLHHFLFVACRENGHREGGKFLTHLASARGLRQVERAGVVPARQISREIHLTTTPMGE